MDMLLRIKSLILGGRYRFTHKAEDEMSDSGLTEDDVLQAIINAPTVQKVLRSKSPARKRKREYLYVLVGLTYSGTLVYTKGTVRRQAEGEVFYIMISAKRAIRWR